MNVEYYLSVKELYNWNGRSNVTSYIIYNKLIYGCLKFNYFIEALEEVYKIARGKNEKITIKPHEQILDCRFKGIGITIIDDSLKLVESIIGKGL